MFMPVVQGRQIFFPHPRRICPLLYNNLAKKQQLAAEMKGNWFCVGRWTALLSAASLRSRRRGTVQIIRIRRASKRPYPCPSNSGFRVLQGERRGRTPV